MGAVDVLNGGTVPKSPNMAVVNTPAFSRIALVLVLSGLAGGSLHARVGETQAEVERRLLQPNVGKLFFRPKDNDRREAERRAREERAQPFNDARAFFPAEAREAIYWKSALASQLSNDNGWKVHVFYVGGRSTLEAYQRVGEGLNEFEVRALLMMNRGSSVWKKVASEGGGTNGIGHDYELEDGSLRARQQGNWLMFFATRLDTYVIEQQKIAKEAKDREDELRRQEQQNKAPESVSGF